MVRLYIKWRLPNGLHKTKAFRCPIHMVDDCQWHLCEGAARLGLTFVQAHRRSA